MRVSDMIAWLEAMITQADECYSPSELTNGVVDGTGEAIAPRQVTIAHLVDHLREDYKGQDVIVVVGSTAQVVYYDVEGPPTFDAKVVRLTI